ncbi:MAG: prepilin peptidase [Deltaproteobacteria bacterium]|nr:prepilin peptidase [Deltaproteobacteria bacterium]MBW2393514.1 prepilin peptidase [Deltaproteobacteria bacterium]
MSDLFRPGVLHGGYPERVEPRSPRLERKLSQLWERARGERPGVAELRARAREVIARSDALVGMSCDELTRRLVEVRPALRRALAGEPLIEVLALVRERARRELGMAHFEVQLMAGMGMLHGMLVELDTGEGKTLSATLPAAVAALAGIPVHVITVNDYLVERDAEAMGPLYRALGLSVGTVVDRDPDPEIRRRAYACDITYVTNKQIAFDYLRDRLSRPNRSEALRGEVKRLQQEGQQGAGLLLRGLCYAIVDEADSVLVDEARTPLILSRNVPAPGLEEIARQATRVAARLREDQDYRLSPDGRSADVTESGRARIGELSEGYGGLWNAPLRRAELVRVALTAERGYVRDEDYVVRDGKLEIVDAQTGRSMPDRCWEGGLQQMIELKEGCEISGERETIARISYQQFYRRYLRLGGMTGTGREVSREIEDVYGLPMIRIEPRLPTLRLDRGVRVLPTRHEKWAAVVGCLRALLAEDRPVLVGTASVRSSEDLGRTLAEAGLPYVLLNALQNADEAEIIGRAGESGRITVATNMAGRGSDIRVTEDVEQSGGLHVLSVERAEARRIDRQLFGRCGRQGDAGSFEQVLSIEDGFIADRSPAWLVRLLQRALRQAWPGAGLLARAWVAWVQRRVESGHAEQRAQLLRSEVELERALAFAGAAE